MDRKTLVCKAPKRRRERRPGAPLTHKFVFLYYGLIAYSSIYGVPGSSRPTKITSFKKEGHILVDAQIAKRVAVRAEKKTMKRQNITEIWQCYLMISTQIIGFLVLSVYPIFWTLRWAFYNYNGVPSETRFIGLQNFINLFTIDTTYWKVWGNTVLFAVCKMPVELTFAMILALLLNRNIKGKNFFRSMYYLPNIISVAVIGLVFSNLFSYWGWVNAALERLGLISSGIDWFASKGTAFTVLLTGAVWNTFGINVMYFMAALAGVPAEVYESAKLDGASKSVTFFKITIPMIAPIFKIVLLLSMIGTLSVNDYILALTNGGPAGETFTVMSYLTQQFVPGFAETSTPNIGFGSAMSIVTTIMFALIAWGYNSFSKKMNSAY